MAINYSDFIEQLVTYYDPDSTKNDILEKLVKKEWDIIAYRNIITVDCNTDIPLLYRDVITNIKSPDALLFYIIDNTEYPIRDDTRLLLALTPFKIIYLRTKGYKKKIDITFTLLVMSEKNINNLRNLTVYDNNSIYEFGYIIK